MDRLSSSPIGGRAGAPTDLVVTVENVRANVGHNQFTGASAFSTLADDGNGATSGSVPVDGASPNGNGDTVTVLGNTGALARTGYSFAGWNTAPDWSGAAGVTAAGDRNLDGEVHAVAVWRRALTANEIATLTSPYQA